MDMGQIMAVMQQMPGGQDGLPSAESGGLAVPGGLFAGVLQGLSFQKTELPHAVVQNVPQEVPVLEKQGEVALDTLMAMMALAGTTAPSTAGFAAESTDNGVDAAVRQNADSESQNVKVTLAPLESGQDITLQAGGIAGAAVVMPGEPALQKVQQVQDAGQADSAIVALPVSRISPVVDSGVTDSATLPARQAAVIEHGSEVKGPSVTTQPATLEVEPSTLQHLTVVQNFSENRMAGQKQAALFQKETAVTERGEQLPQGLQADHKPDGSLTGKPAEQRREGALQPVVGTSHQRLSESNPGITALRQEYPVTMVKVAAGSVTSNTLIVGTENRVLQLEIPDQAVVSSSTQGLPSETKIVQLPLQTLTQPVTQKPMHTEVPSETTDAKPVVVSVSAKLSESSETAPVPPEFQAVQHKMRVSVPVVSLAETSVRAADVQLEKQSATPELRGTSTRQSSEKLDHAAGIAVVAAGEMKSGSSEGETFGQNLNGNFLPNTVHQQIKTEGPASVAPTGGAETVELPRTAHTAEQVVQQVRERLVNHVAKPGNEQIVLRLTPEHLGELKLNLNMDGQRLKVEIVAENAMVRDSLMQNTDLLKESLSRQNIKMESFDVTTGGNSSTDSGRGQGEWRELAQRRQQNLWMPEGGYRMAKQAAPAVTAYQPRSQHTMVDVHF